MRQDLAEETFDIKTERLADRLLQALSAAPSEAAAFEIIARRFSELQKDDALDLLEFVDDGIRRRAELGQLFLYLLELPAMEAELPAGFWQDLRQELMKRRPVLADAMVRFGKNEPPDRRIIRAKTALLLEIRYLLLQETGDESVQQSREVTAGEEALRVLRSPRPSSTTLEVESTSYPLGSRKLVVEILTELDFLESGDTVWEFTLTESIMEGLGKGQNLSSHRAAGSAMSQAMVTRLAENLVKRFGFIIRSIGMYPAGHPAIQPSVDTFMNLLDQLMGDAPMVTLTVMGSDLMVNDLQVRKKSRATENFIKDMADRNINSLSIHPGVGSDDVLRFASVFNKPPIYIKEHGGMPKLMERRDIGHISIDQFHYALVSDDGTVVGHTSSPEEAALEDVIFGELVERLERGDSLRDLPDEKVGEALKAVLQDAGAGVDRQRSLLASFVAALDPSILEKGLLSRQDVQRDMAWSAVRRIIKARLRDLGSSDEDVRLEAIEKLMGFALIAIERNKDNTVMQLLEAMTGRLEKETSPDCLFTAISATGTLFERLIACGKLASAQLPGRILSQQDSIESADPDISSARRRALAEAKRRIDTPEVADALLQRLMSQNEVMAREAEALSSVLPLTNLVTHLIEVFLEPEIKRRARAYRILKKLGERALPLMHGRLSRLSHRYETRRDPSTGELTDDDWYVARNVMGILGELESPSSIEVLKNLCYDPDERIRQRSLVALARVSEGDAYEAAIRMIEDRSEEVARTALDLAVKEAHFRINATSRIIEVFSQRPAMWPDFLNAMEWLLGSPEVRPYLSGVFSEEDPLPFGDPALCCQAADMLADVGIEEDLEVLKGYLSRVSGGGILKRKGVDKSVLASVSTAVSAIEARLVGRADSRPGRQRPPMGTDGDAGPGGEDGFPES